MRKTKTLFAFLCLFSLTGLAQTVPPQTNAVRTNAVIKIDGLINEEAWKQATAISGLTEQRPTPGRAENPANRTEVYLLYDDNAVYFGGILHDKRDSISTQLGGRDVIGVNDFIGVVFDTYQDK